MTWKAPKSDYEKHPTGMIAARCYRVVDLGTHYNERWMKNSHYIRVDFETARKMKDGRPFSIGQRFTFSMHENAGLRKALESWRGRRFTEEQANDFDFEKLLGVTALLSVAHSDDGKYANIMSINPLPAEMPAPAQVNEQFIFILGQREDCFEKLSKNLQEFIGKSNERTGGGKPDAEFPLNGEPPAEGGGSPDFDDSQIPF